jgi:tRNA (cmo5U34)-methyltransferase
MSETKIDKTLPEGKWKFDGNVTDVFDNMLERSIPQYHLMRQTCFDIARPHVVPNTTIMDLGCSRGEALAPFLEQFGAFNRYVGIDVSEPMLAAARKRFKHRIDSHLCDVKNFDLRTGFPPEKCSVILSILTLQFTPIEHRLRILQDVYDHLLPGGCFLLVEKVIGATAKIDRLMVNAYYDFKKANGYSQDEIDRKRLSLEGVLVPLTAEWNLRMLPGLGSRRWIVSGVG